MNIHKFIDLNEVIASNHPLANGTTDSVQKTLCGSLAAVLAYLMWADLTLWLAVVRYVASETIGVRPDRFKSIDGDNPDVEVSEDNSEWEDF